MSRAALLGAFALSLAASARAEVLKPDVVDAANLHVVGRGFEAVLTDLLGGNDVLAGGCRLETVRAEGTWILAGWQCDKAKAVRGFLQHPSVGGSAEFETERFKVKRAGTAPWPPGLGAALEARIRAREAKFEWTTPTQGSKVAPGTFQQEQAAPGTVASEQSHGIVDEPKGQPLVNHRDGMDPNDRHGKAPRKKVPVTYVVLTLLGVGGAVRWLSRRSKAARAATLPEPPPPSAE